MFQRLLCPLKHFVLFGEKGFYSFPKLVITHNISYIEVIKVIFLCFSNHCNTEVSLFVASLFTFLRFWLQNFIACVNLNGSSQLFALLPYKHSTCIPRWNGVETFVSTSFQRGIHVVCLLGLVIKEEWLFLKVSCFEGVNLFKSPRRIVWNNLD